MPRLAPLRCCFVLAHHRDEGVLDGGARLARARERDARRRASASRTQRLGIGAAARGDAQHVAVVRDLVDAGLRAQQLGGVASARVDLELDARAEPRALDDLARACRRRAARRGR